VGAEAAQAGWLTIVASSAGVSAVVNFLGNYWLKRSDRTREDRREKARIDPIKLGVAQQLEAFAKRCLRRMYAIDEGMDEYYQHVPNAFSRVQQTFSFKFAESTEWSELPIGFVARMKSMPGDFEAASDWISRQFEWADAAECYEFELEQLAFYGSP
jgi:hypothetical protein